MLRLDYVNVELLEINKFNLFWIAGIFHRKMLEGDPLYNNCSIFSSPDWENTRQDSIDFMTRGTVDDDAVSTIVTLAENIQMYLDINIDRKQSHVFTICSAKTKRIIGFAAIGPVKDSTLPPEIEITLWEDDREDYDVQKFKDDTFEALDRHFKPENLQYKELKEV